MTLRSVRTLDRKLREQEAASIEAIRSILAEVVLRVLDLAVESSRHVREQPALMSVLRDGYGDVLTQAGLLLRSTMEENLKALGRDLLALEATVGPEFDGLAKVAFDKLDGEESFAVFEEGMRSSLSAGFRLMIEEMERQRFLSERYDVAFDRLIDRWTKATPNRLMGRSGRGVILSWEAMINAVVVNWMYAMVNAQRQLVAEEADRILGRVTVDSRS